MKNDYCEWCEEHGYSKENNCVAIWKRIGKENEDRVKEIIADGKKRKFFSKYEKNWLYWVLKSEGVEHLEMGNV